MKTLSNMKPSRRLAGIEFYSLRISSRVWYELNTKIERDPIFGRVAVVSWVVMKNSLVLINEYRERHSLTKSLFWAIKQCWNNRRNIIEWWSRQESKNKESRPNRESRVRSSRFWTRIFSLLCSPGRKQLTHQRSKSIVTQSYFYFPQMQKEYCQRNLPSAVPTNTMKIHHPLTAEYTRTGNTWRIPSFLSGFYQHTTSF